MHLWLQLIALVFFLAYCYLRLLQLLNCNKYSMVKICAVISMRMLLLFQFCVYRWIIEKFTSVSWRQLPKKLTEKRQLPQSPQLNRQHCNNKLPRIHQAASHTCERGKKTIHSTYTREHTYTRTQRDSTLKYIENEKIARWCQGWWKFAKFNTSCSGIGLQWVVYIAYNQHYQLRSYAFVRTAHQQPKKPTTPPNKQINK